MGAHLSQAGAVEDAVGRAIAALAEEEAVVEAEADAGESVVQIALDSRALLGLADRLAGGAASGYMAPAQRGALEAVRGRLLSAAPAVRLRERPTPEMVAHAEGHALGVAPAVGEAELAAVGLEAPGVPVSEPNERTAAAAPLVAAGAAAVLVALLLSGR